MAVATSKSRFISGFGFQVLIAMVIGLGLGLLARELGPAKGEAGFALAETLRQIGSIFVQLLRVLVPPLVFTAIVASIANLAELQNAARLVWRTLFWFAVTALIAVLIGIALGLILQPGLHTTVAAAQAQAPKTSGSWLDFLTGLVPANVLGLTASTTVNDAGVAKTSLSFNVLQILVISLITGVAALKAGGENLTPEQAIDLVFGYAVGVDLTRRDLQAAAKAKSHPWEAAKAFDASAPISAIRPISGPPPQGAIFLSVNGVERQRGQIADMIWNVAEVIAQASQLWRLEAGDLIFTGTPEGVGAIVRGDRVEGEVEGVGKLSFTVV